MLKRTLRGPRISVKRRPFRDGISGRDFYTAAIMAVILGGTIGFTLGNLGVMEQAAEMGMLRSIETKSIKKIDPARPFAHERGRSAQARSSRQAQSYQLAYSEDAEALRQKTQDTPPLIEVGPYVAIVIDDMGLNEARSTKVIELEIPLTLSFLPYGASVNNDVSLALEAGHEVMVHIPMEAAGGEYPGPNALFTTYNRQEIAQKIDWLLDRFDGYVGVNNHMGSRFTTDESAMRHFLSVVRQRDLFFLDSRTTPQTVGVRVARSLGVPTIERDVFLDNQITEVSIETRLDLLEKEARRKGGAVGIGHPHNATINVIRSWQQAARERGIRFVTVSQLIQRRRSANRQSVTMASPGRSVY
jgi:hypothetical protein